jgi:hypothetical protein
MSETTLNAILALLIPIFLKVAGNDDVLARATALQTLNAYRPSNEAEAILAAEIIVLGFATIDNLSQSLADPDMGITTRLRLRSNAGTLHRAADRNRQILARANTPQLAKPAKQPTTAFDPVDKMRDALIDAAPVLAERLTTLSRQQRRFLMRKAEQARAAQEKAVRLTARNAQRTEQGTRAA